MNGNTKRARAPITVGDAEPFGSHVPRPGPQASWRGESRHRVLVDDRGTAQKDRGERVRGSDRHSRPSPCGRGSRRTPRLRGCLTLRTTRGVPARRRPLEIRVPSRGRISASGSADTSFGCGVEIRAGRRSSINRFVWTITSSPAPRAPTISSQPDERTTSTDASFAFSVTDGDGAECRLDSGAWIACSSLAMYVGVGVGSHLFCVRAVNGSGVIGPETCVTWTVLASPSTPDADRAVHDLGRSPERPQPGRERTACR